MATTSNAPRRGRNKLCTQDFVHSNPTQLKPTTINPSSEGSTTIDGRRHLDHALQRATQRGACLTRETSLPQPGFESCLASISFFLGSRAPARAGSSTSCRSPADQRASALSASAQSAGRQQPRRSRPPARLPRIPSVALASRRTRPSPAPRVAHASPPANPTCAAAPPCAGCGLRPPPPARGQRAPAEMGPWGKKNGSRPRPEADPQPAQHNASARKADAPALRPSKTNAVLHI